MRRKTRTLCLLMSLLMALAIFAGCQTTEQNSTSSPAAEQTPDNSKSENTSEAEPEDNAEAPEPITFSVYTTGNMSNTPKWGSDPVSAVILAKTGVTLNIEYAVDDSSTKLGLMLSAGDYPDMLNSINNDTVALYAEAGALVPLNDYIEPYGENVKKVFGDQIGAMKSESDGNIYGFNGKYGEMSIAPFGNMQVQIALLEEFGYPKINYLYELTDLIEQYVAKYPQYEGQDTVGLMSPASGWVFNICFNNAALRSAGYQDDGNYYIDPETLEASLGITTDSAKEYLLWVNDLNRKGLFDMESFTLDSNSANEKLATGRVLAISAPTWFTSDGEAALRNAGLEDRGYAKIPLFINQEAKENSRLHYYDPYGTWKCVITNNCADPVRAFQFIDSLWSEEIQILCNWGVEGINYTVDENGKRVMNNSDLIDYKSDEYYRQKTGVLLYFTSGAYVKDSTGQYLNPFNVPENLRAGYSEKEKEVLAAYDSEAVIWRDLYPESAISEWGFAWKLTLPTDSDGAIAEKKVEGELRAKYTYDLVMAQTQEEFDTIWDDFVKACEDAGIGKREAEITEALKKRMELWYN